MACGIVPAAAMFWQVRTDPTLLVMASPTDIPPVPVVACLGILVGMLPAVLAPPLPRPMMEASPAREEVAA